MPVVDNLFNDNVPITITGGIELTANLSASPWNRTTVADGYWLQSKTVDPFSARDIYLANCIDDVSAAINDIETTISNGTTNSLISMNDVIYSANDYWEDLPATIAPSNTSKAAPSNTLTYMTLGETSDLATDDISQINDRTCLIQGNLTENSFNQILLTDSGMFYRSVSGNETTSMSGDNVDSYDLLTTDKKFAQILDDSTIDDPGYWFLHKESSGRPVWTNINALGEYIDNRVNPDGVYVGWSANDPESELPERKLVLFPPNSGNTTTAINPTDEAYTNNAYAWSESGWVALEPLVSRNEFNEFVDSFGNASYHDYRNLPIVACTGADFDPIPNTGATGMYAVCLQEFAIPSANKVKVDGFYQIKGGMNANGTVPDFGADPKIQTWILDTANNSAIKINIASLTNGYWLPRSVPIPFSFVTGGTDNFSIGFCSEGTWTATNNENYARAGDLLVSYTVTVINN